MQYLSDISELRQVTQSLATLDAILSPEWEYRYYSFDKTWDTNEQMASMRNGSGDEWYLLFHDDGWSALVGWDHESPAASVEGFGEKLRSSVPETLNTFSTEPAFSWERATFCYWNLSDGKGWIEPPFLEEFQTGASYHLSILNSGARGYVEFAAEYYEMSIPLELVEKVFDHVVLTEQIVKGLNSDCSLDEIRDDLESIGFPFAV